MLPPGESWWVCRRDRQTNGHQTITLHCSFGCGRSQRNKWSKRKIALVESDCVRAVCSWISSAYCCYWMPYDWAVIESVDDEMTGTPNNRALGHTCRMWYTDLQSMILPARNAGLYVHDCCTPVWVVDRICHCTEEVTAGWRTMG